MAFAKGSVDSSTDLARLHRVHVLLVFIAFTGSARDDVTASGILAELIWFAGQVVTS